MFEGRQQLTILKTNIRDIITGPGGGLLTGYPMTQPILISRYCGYQAILQAHQRQFVGLLKFDKDVRDGASLDLGVGDQTR